MNNAMTAHEPINYLDSVLDEEDEKRTCEYGHQWRNFTISRSGRFKSKNKKRDAVDGKLFTASPWSEPLNFKEDRCRNDGSNYKEQEVTARQSSNLSKPLQQQMGAGGNPRSATDKSSYKSYYETNL